MPAAQNLLVAKAAQAPVPDAALENIPRMSAERATAALKTLGVNFQKTAAA
jgi:hypothetical protein